jgi:hypothetical protein
LVASEVPLLPPLPPLLEVPFALVLAAAPPDPAAPLVEPPPVLEPLLVAPVVAAPAGPSSPGLSLLLQAISTAMSTEDPEIAWVAMSRSVGHPLPRTKTGLS